MTIVRTFNSVGILQLLHREFLRSSGRAPLGNRIRNDVGSRVADSVRISTGPVAGVDGLGLVPSTGVENAVGAERKIVLGKNVRVEEVAGLVAAI